MAVSEIAIIGLSGRYPGGAEDLSKLWQLLRSGSDAISEATADRWDLGYFDPDPEQPNRVYTRAGGFLDRVDGFDSDFFSMSPREARQVDPQQRLLLELTWEACEDAAIVPETLAGSQTGVFVGISSHDYADLGSVQSPDAYSNTGSALSIAANRISYVFDLHGPSLAIDTACSSGLVAVHQACRALIEGSCDRAIVGAVNILSHPKSWIGFAKASMLSPTGRCRSFDAAGDGYVRSEGGGVVILKPLAAAEKDGDCIYGVIVASGVNSDGRTMGLSMPNKQAQEALLRQVYGAAGIIADDVFYVEAHGTGTSVGDPAECEAIGRVLGAPRQSGTPCRIGSIKSNIGHLEPAAGIAGMTKVLLALRHRELPANLHFNNPNPRIDFDAWKLHVVDQPTPLPESVNPLLFGINSFGFGGTNAHAVIREYRAPPAKTVPAKAGQQMLLLSARSQAALTEVARTYSEWLCTQKADDWPAICATAAMHRSRHSHRLALAAASAEDAAQRLQAFATGGATPAVASARVVAEPKGVAFVYSGNGPQWWAMGRQLLDKNPVFQAEMDAVDAIFRARAGWSLIDELRQPEEASRMARTEVAQPTLFALQLGITAVLRSMGIHPTVVFGHSVGEVAAAHVSGALTREQATEVIIHRSSMQARTAGLGKMAALGIGEDEARAAMGDAGGALELAAINAPRSVTVAGDPSALEALRATLTEMGKFARVLPLNYAFHSRMMDPIREDLLRRLEGMIPADTAANAVFVSTVEGRVVPAATLGAEYWWRNIREPVMFDAAVGSVLKDLGVSTFVEIGPHPVLCDYVLQSARARDVAAVAIPTLRRPAPNRQEPEDQNMWLAICACHAQSVGRVEAVFERPAKPVALPPYPWQRTRYWRGAMPLADVLPPIERDHPLLGWRPPGSQGVWQNLLDLSQLGYLADHVIQDAILFPAAGHIEIALAAAARIFGDGAMDLEDFQIMRPLVVTSRPIAALDCSVDVGDGACEIRSRPDLHADTPATHLRTRIARGPAGLPEPVDLIKLRSGLPHHMTAGEHYAGALLRGMTYGPTFRGIEAIWLSPPGESPATGLAKIKVPQSGLDGYRAHPTILDACFQLVMPLLARGEARTCTYLPVQFDRVRSYAPLPAQVYCFITITQESRHSAVVETAIFDSAGATLMSLSGARVRKVDFRASAGPLLTEGWWLDSAKSGLEVLAPLASPAQIAEDVERDIASLLVDLERPKYYAEIAPRFDALAGAYASQALRTIAGEDAPFTLTDLRRLGRIAPKQMALLARLVGMAEADGLLVRQGARWAWSDAPAPDPVRLWRSLILDHPAYTAELVLCARHGEFLPSALRGVEPAAETSDVFTGQLYDGSPFKAVAHHMVERSLRLLLAAWPAGRPVRVLEIAGSSLGMTAALLPLLPAKTTDYVFSSALPEVLERARQRFGDQAQLRTVKLDSDEDAGTQGLQEASFDLVVTGEALNASADPAEVLAMARSMLVPGGWLIVTGRANSRLEELLYGAQWPKPSLHVVGAEEDGTLQELRRAGFAEFAIMSDHVAAGDLRKAEQSVVLARRAAGSGELNDDAVPTEAKHDWLLLIGENHAEAAFAESVAKALRSRGEVVSVVALGDPASDASAFTAQIAAAVRVGAGQIVHMAGLAGGMADEPDGLLKLQDLRVVPMLGLVQEIATAASGYAPGLHLVTHAALDGPGETEQHPEQAPLWGFGRVLANEHPDLRARLIDLHLDLDDTAAKALADELLRLDDETEVLLSDGQRFVNRVEVSSLHRLSARPADGDQKAYHLELGLKGGIDSLYLRSVPIPSPGPGEILIRVHAAGLNFRDVLWAMGMLPEEAVESGFSGATIGMECAGEVVATGEGADFVVGDHVVAFGSSTFASHLVTSANTAARVPDHIGYAEAATIPITFLTAFYALDHLARLKKGERVLIHGAAGGVGLAAIQIAKLKGAIVFGSAGSDDKRRVLRLMGVDHVLNSRSLEFADEVMRLTGGEGVDVVLNSLVGEAITKNLQILRPFGRFLEIGKRDLYANSRIGLRPFRNNLSYFGIDADTLLSERPDLARDVFAELMSLFASGQLRPLPYTAIPVARAGEAFRLMQQSRHIGKIVLTMTPEAAGAAVNIEPAALRADATYLVTGGLGGFGLATARWLVAQGARHLALVGRRGATTEEAKSGISFLESLGARVMPIAADITIPGDVANILAQINQTMPPLRGVFHAAMVLDDAPILNLDRERLRQVLAPKLAGSWSLHEATRNMPLDYFVLYSSGTTVVGNPGQANYVAANIYLEALAQYRRAQGLPALAISWGAIKDVGILTRSAGLEAMLQNRTGMSALPAAEALAELGRLMETEASRVSVAQFNLQRLGAMLPVVKAPRFRFMAPDGPADHAGPAGDTLESILSATPPSERRDFVFARLREYVGRVLGTGASQVDPDRTLSELGIDSLMAVELAEAVEQDIGKPVPVMQLIQAGSLSAMTDLVLTALGGSSEGAKLAAD